MSDRGSRARGGRGGGRGGDGARGGRGGRGDGGQSRGRGGYQGEGRGGGDGGQGRGRGRGAYQGEGRRGGRGRGGYQGEGRGGGGRGRGGRGDRGGRSAFSAGGRGGAPPAERHDLPATFPEPPREITRLEDDFFSVEAKMARKGIQDDALALPERPSFSANGEPVKLWANSYTVSLKIKNDIWACNIEVVKRPQQPSPSNTGEPATRAVRGPVLAAVIVEALRQIQLLNPGISITSEFKSRLVATQRIVLPNDSLEVTLDRVTYNVSLVGGQPVTVDALMRYLQDMNDRDTRYPKFEDTLNALNVVLGHAARNDPAISAIGSNRFFNTGAMADPHERYDLFCGILEIRRGYFQSLRLSTGRLLLNTNTTYGVFRLEGELSEYFTKAGIDRRRPDSTFRSMAMLLSRARVECRFKNDAQEEGTQRKTILGIFNGDKVTGENVRIQSDGHIPGPGQVQFHNGTEFISVMDHYRKRYGVKLNPNWPLLCTGTLQNPKFTPAEFCRVLSTAIKTKLNDSDSEAMINFACRRPGDNYHFITTRAPALLRHNSPLLDRFGLSVDGKLVTVHGRELPPPTIKYGGDNRVQPKFGAWNMVQKKFATPPHDKVHWAYMAMLHQDRAPGNDVEHVVNSFRQHVANACGIPMGNPISGRCHPDASESQIREAFKSQLGVPSPKIVLVFLPDKDTDRYARLKRVADVELGIHTVCMNWTKAVKCQPPYFGNVALKWNLKLGGINHRLDDRVGLIQSGKTMLVGYDVTHPTGAPEPKKKSGGKKGSDEPESEMPSIVGLVASIDKDVNQWPSAAWVHASRREVCQDDQLMDAFGSRLDLWKQRNRAFPENIIIYRDGVSESQFQQVLESELPKIRAACEKRYPPNKRPSLAIIVSVKRHHTRFYPAEKDKASKSGNIRPGTVVDRGVTQARYWDFYLAAHDCLQGTARPAHYTVLLDEIFRNRRGGRPAESLETITHDLCYMFGRATRAVSICPPAYYADIVCERIRVHRGGRGQWEVHQNLRNSMYYV